MDIFALKQKSKLSKYTILDKKLGVAEETEATIR